MRDVRAASTLQCVRQGLYFQLFETEFMVNAHQPEMPRSFV
jgi:hypothetical protein